MSEAVPKKLLPQGMYAGKLDQQVRLKIPSDWANYFNSWEDKRLFCTSFDERNGLIYPMEVWQSNLDFLDNSEDTESSEVVTFTANKNGGTATMDPQNRLVFPANLRDALKLSEGQTIYLYCHRGHAEMLTEAGYQARTNITAPLAQSAADKMRKAGMK